MKQKEVEKSPGAVDKLKYHDRGYSLATIIGPVTTEYLADILEEDMNIDHIYTEFEPQIRLLVEALRAGAEKYKLATIDNKRVKRAQRRRVARLFTESFNSDFAFYVANSINDILAGDWLDEFTTEFVYMLFDSAEATAGVEIRAREKAKDKADKAARAKEKTMGRKALHDRNRKRVKGGKLE